MSPFLALIIGILIGAGFFWWYLGTRGRGETAQEGMAAYQERRQKEKEENKQNILVRMGEEGKLRNNDVERLLGVSDAQATRYLQELEDENRIRQVGKEGKYVYYEVI